MSDGMNQKLKILFTKDFLSYNSDFEHPVSVQKIIEHLENNGLTAERKSVYDDIEQLQLYGEDIVKRRGRNGGYYYDTQKFELPELKMLVDSVQSSKFITEEQSLELIKKLEGLTNKYNAAALHRQVVVRNRVKTVQTNIFNNIDHISAAINSDCTVKFRYITYDLHKKPIFRHDGDFYEISPYCLIWDDENYYLLGYDAAQDKIKHFRVDKMVNLSATQEKRAGKEKFGEIDISSYNKKVFNMYSGEQTTVKIRFKNHLVGVVLDKFGMNASICPENDGEHFTVATDISVSKQFYSWLFGFAGECEVISPEFVREQVRQTARLMLTAADSK
ncbi:MAG: WYL domain-containing protein [Clostridia bacterium]|nr:WYL domain-containing protein [Clostridia bacterium]